MIPCLIFEDEHLLVVNKPAGMNTHAPGPFTGEGIYDWLRHREPRWADLAIIHRLDKETSGVIVFGKTPLANRSLTAQFTQRTVRKKYLLLTDRLPKRREFVAESCITRAGDRYVSSRHGEPAKTGFRVLNSKFKIQNSKLIEAEPLSGRTHQVRVHAAENGVPILGDTLYGGSKFGRVCLHAAELTLQHPATGKESEFRAPVDFLADTHLALRAALLDLQETTAFRLIHGASDGWPGWYLDRLGDFLLSQGEGVLGEKQRDYLKRLLAGDSSIALHASRITGAYHKPLQRQVRGATPADASPKLALGSPGPDRFAVRENGVRFELSFNEGYSSGLFLDQRDNRRRLLTGHLAANFELSNLNRESQSAELRVLNTFAYTCGFSVCAAKAGARTTSVDLSKKYLAWGRRNFMLNGLDPAAHEFIYGDTLDWLRRLAKKRRFFDVILLDPPTFSQSKKLGAFRVEKDYPGLIGTALALLKTEGVLFASTNSAGWSPEKFVNSVEGAVRAANRKILQSFYATQPPDFPVSRNEPAYLKTVWMRIQ